MAKSKVKVEAANGNGEGGHARTSDGELKKLLRALQAVRDGDFSARLAPDQTGLAGKIADAFNEMVSANERMAKELERVGQMVGKEGKTRIRVAAERRSGAWGAMDFSVNTLIEDLLWPTTEVTRTITAVDGVSLMEFGTPEAMWHLTLQDFPAIVTMDAHGNSLHTEVEKASAAELAAIGA